LTHKNEQQLVKIIKYFPSVLITFLGIVTIVFLFVEEQRIFEQEKKSVQREFLSQNKIHIKNHIENLHLYIQNKQKTTEIKLKNLLKSSMDNAYNIAMSLYENNQDKTDEEIKKIIKDALRQIRFNEGRGYFFIHDKNTYSSAMHPIMPRLEGKNSYNVKDAKGVYILREMHNILKEKDASFYQWYWYKPGNQKKQYKKIGYIKNFKPFNWFIATGEYVEDFEKHIQKDVLAHIKTLRDDDNRYTFVFNYDGTFLSHINEALVGENVFETTILMQNNLIFKKMINLAKNNADYLSYIQKVKPGTNNSEEKTSYVKGVKDWNWIIGTGFYQDDMNILVDERRERLRDSFSKYTGNILVISTIITFVLLLISIYFSKVVQSKFANYRKEIMSKIQENKRQVELLSQQAKMAAMGEMIGNIAHQWRQPLSTITVAATGIKIQKEMNILSDEHFINSVDAINNSAQHLSSTIDDFKNFFSDDKEKAIFRVDEAISATLKLTNAQFGNKEIEIVEQTSPLAIFNLKNEFIQVIMNILTNSKDELIKLPKQRHRAIFIDVFKKDKSVCIQIKDTAGGIPNKIIRRIFEPYFTTKHKAQGTGIGLYMSQEIISKHMKGTLSVDNHLFEYKNQKCKGAIFTIMLPINGDN